MTPATSPARSGTSTEDSSWNEPAARRSGAERSGRRAAADAPALYALLAYAPQPAPVLAGANRARRARAPAGGCRHRALEHEPPALALHGGDGARAPARDCRRRARPRRRDEGDRRPWPPRRRLRQLLRLLSRAARERRRHHHPAVPRARRSDRVLHRFGWRRPEPIHDQRGHAGRAGLDIGRRDAAVARGPRRGTGRMLDGRSHDRARGDRTAVRNRPALAYAGRGRPRSPRSRLAVRRLSPGRKSIERVTEFIE